MDGTDYDGVLLVFNRPATLSLHHLLNYASTQTNDERDDKNAGDGQQQTDYHKDGIVLEVRK